MFRRLVLALLVLLIFLPSTGCNIRMRKKSHTAGTPAPFTGWKSVSPDGLFTVMMPTDPSNDRRMMRDRERLSYSSKSRNELYRVTVFATADNDRAAKNAADGKKVLERYADTWSKSGHTDTKVDGQPAIEVKWADPSKHEYRGRVVQSADGHAVYLIRARWVGASEPPNVAQFFDSFKLGTYTRRPEATPSAATSPSTVGASPTPSSAASPSGQPESEEGEVRDVPDSSEKEEGEGEE